MMQKKKPCEVVGCRGTTIERRMHGCRTCPFDDVEGKREVD